MYPLAFPHSSYVATLAAPGNCLFCLFNLPFIECPHLSPSTSTPAEVGLTACGAWDVGRNSRLSQELLGCLIQQGHGHQAPLWGARGGGVQGVGGEQEEAGDGLGEV